MLLLSLIKKGQLVHEASSETEINELFEIVERDLKDSQYKNLSADWKFGISYNAALKLATILVRSSGHRVRGTGFHHNTIQLIIHFLGSKHLSDAEYLEACRRKRNLLEYDCVGGVTEEEAKELRDFVLEFKKIVKKHLLGMYPRA